MSHFPDEVIIFQFTTVDDIPKGIDLSHDVHEARLTRVERKENNKLYIYVAVSEFNKLTTLEEKRNAVLQAGMHAIRVLNKILNCNFLNDL